MTITELLAVWQERAKHSYHAHAWFDAVKELEEALDEMPMIGPSTSNPFLVEDPPAPTDAKPITSNGRDLLAHVVQYDPADAGARVVAAKIIAVEQEAIALVRIPE